MARYKACYPIFGKCADNTPEKDSAIDDFVAIGKMVDVEIKPNFDEAVSYGDDGIAEQVKEFKDADITNNIDELALAAAKKMYNFDESEDNENLIVDNAEKTSNYGSYGYIYGRRKNGVTSYTAVMLHRVLWDLPSEKSTTKGDSITFENESLTGKAYRDRAGQWRTRMFNIATLSEAKTILQKLVKRDTEYSVQSEDNGDVVIVPDNTEE